MFSRFFRALRNRFDDWSTPFSGGRQPAYIPTKDANRRRVNEFLRRQKLMTETKLLVAFSLLLSLYAIATAPAEVRGILAITFIVATMVVGFFANRSFRE